MHWFRNIDTGHALWQGGALALLCYTICCMVTTAWADVGLVEVDKQQADQLSSVFRVSLEPRPQDKGEFVVTIGGPVLPDKSVTATLVVGDGHTAQLRGRLHVVQDPKQGDNGSAMWRVTLSVCKEMIPSCAVEIMIDDPARGVATVYRIHLQSFLLHETEAETG